VGTIALVVVRSSLLGFFLDLLELLDRESGETGDRLRLLREPAIEVFDHVKTQQRFTEVFELSDG
jgi:hypothetical protein